MPSIKKSLFFDKGQFVHFKDTNKMAGED